MGLVERFVHGTFGQRVFVLLCLGALVVTGVTAYRDLPVEAFPDLTNNQVSSSPRRRASPPPRWNSASPIRSRRR